MILIVDDNEDLLNSINDLVGLVSNEKILLANEGNSALAILKNNKEIKTIITDINMPNGMGGIDLLKNVKELYPEIKRITMSGYIDNRTEAETMGLAQHYLEKPFSIKALTEVLAHKD